MQLTEGPNEVASKASPEKKTAERPESPKNLAENTLDTPQNWRPKDQSQATNLDTTTDTTRENKDNEESESPVILSPAADDEDEKLENSTDLQFKKKDFQKSRAQLFQSVLLTASLKSLKQQYTSGNPPPQLQRNLSSVSNLGTTNIKNFQLFIQAPVLSSVTNLRPTDEIEIGQQLPFDHRTESDTVFPELAKQSESQTLPILAEKPNQDDPDGTQDDEDDIYREETTLQQQRLTINALKKLSLSLAPIIRSDDDDTELQSRQLTTKLLNGSMAADLKLKLRPYQPAQVDLSSFSSLTRQSKHLPQVDTVSTIKPAVVMEQGQQALQNQIQNDFHKARLLLSSSTEIQNPQNNQNSNISHESQGFQSFQNSQSHLKTLVDLNNQDNHLQSRIQERGRASEKQEFRPVQQTSNLGFKSGAVPVNGFKPTFGNIEHTIGGRKVPVYPVVPPQDMNIRNRKVSIQHEPQPLQAKHPLPDKKLQQIKGFRSPMYVPAVLRRTHEDDQDVGPVNSNGLDPDSIEHITSPLTVVALPPKDTGSSSNSVRSFDLAYSSESLVMPGQHLKTGPFTLSKSRYEHILRAVPTRKHWLKDESVAECGINSCHKHFNFFERRHHCRKCGGIFCKEHTSHYLYINHLAQFTTGGRGTLSRVCDNCIEEYNEFMKNEFGVACHIPRSRELPSQAAPPKATNYHKEIFKPKEPMLLPITPVSKQGDLNEQLVGSVPANWSWLSF